MKCGKKPQGTDYSPTEELFNWLTHAAATILSIGGAFFICWTLAYKNVTSAEKWVSASVYLLATIILYSASTLYHYVKKTKLKQVLRILDHSAIYIKIAGTYTPFLVLALPHRYGYPLLMVLWAIAIVGILFKLFYIKRFNRLSTFIYLGMGWLAVGILWPLYKALPFIAFVFILAGGACFTVGALFYQAKRIPYSHPIWHLFVMGGSTFHYASVYLFIFR